MSVHKEVHSNNDLRKTNISLTSWAGPVGAEFLHTWVSPEKYLNTSKHCVTWVVITREGESILCVPYLGTR